MKKLIAGNWKMNASLKQSAALASEIAQALDKNPAIKNTCDLLICPPFPYLLNVKESCEQHGIALGAQDCSHRENGAYTGETSAEMVKDLGCAYVILGHSERRQYHSESDTLIAQKAEKAHDQGLKTIICVGETESQREFGQEEDIVGAQIMNSVPKSANAKNTVIAYEPVWAIGTGKTAQSSDVKDMHAFIRAQLEERFENAHTIPILYGGSMKPENAQELLATPNVDGGLIGGASLKAEQFIAIASQAMEK